MFTSQASNALKGTSSHIITHHLITTSSLAQSYVLTHFLTDVSFRYFLSFKHPNPYDLFHYSSLSPLYPLPTTHNILPSFLSRSILPSSPSVHQIICHIAVAKQSPYDKFHLHNRILHTEISPSITHKRDPTTLIDIRLVGYFD